MFCRQWSALTKSPCTSTTLGASAALSSPAARYRTVWPRHAQYSFASPSAFVAGCGSTAAPSAPRRARARGGGTKPRDTHRAAAKRRVVRAIV